ncbi:MAG: succinate dehydrogenase cytochrome b subunit [Acidimicrobiia bacterium]|nr:succinate dehydrogenase cytochrome b subunit [Acidimicrobiia bacterium]
MATSLKSPPKKRRLPYLLDIYGSDVGKKYAMAISGILAMLFVFGHMLGNLHVFEGFDAAAGEFRIDEYGEALRDIGEPLAPRTLLLWAFRLVMIVALVVHVHAAWALTVSNRRARGTERYDDQTYIAVNFASRTMRWTGVIILLFLGFHLADLTLGWTNPDFVRGHVYDNLLGSLSRWPVWLFYVVAQGALALHLYHGAWSLFQSLGINNPSWNRYRRPFATAFAALVVAGFLTVPVGVATGLIS